MRVEKDFLGTMEIPGEALYGIHSMRASGNFPHPRPFHIEWYKATATVKMACYNTVLKFIDAIETEHPDILSSLNLPSKETLEWLAKSAAELAEGKHFENFIVSSLQGGAGTSINMNINEIICNRALEISGNKPGQYDLIDPIQDANIYQSTNDVIPTALKVAVMELLNTLEISINKSRAETEKLEKRYKNSLRIAFTQLQEAVPGTYGQLFSTYSDALSRDWWRVSKAAERIKQVNLGGGASGTGISIPRYFIMEVVPQLRNITQLPLAQGENLSDITANLDSLVEVHAILKTHAVNLEKIVSDLRLLSSGLSGEKELSIPDKQTGSSIMPGKINPVIPEFVISSAHQIYSNDQLITGLAGQGNLELNAYLPSIGHALIESIKLMISMNQSLSKNLLSGIAIDEEKAASRLYKSPAVTTALSPLIGYNKAAELAYHMRSEKKDIFAANRDLSLLPHARLEKLMKAEYLIKKGFTVKDIREFNDDAK